MFNFKKKVLFGLSVSLVLAMAIGSFALGESQITVTTQAETQSVAATNDYDTGDFTVEGGTAVTDYDYANGILNIHPQSSDTEITIKNTNVNPDGSPVETTDAISIITGPGDADNTVNIKLAGVNIKIDRSALEIEADAKFNVNITLEDGTKNTLTSTETDWAGLDKSVNHPSNTDGKLTIRGTGELIANGGGGSAGIGGGSGSHTDNIYITGGKIEANGGNGAAGLGGGSNGNAKNIEIAGAEVTANGLVDQGAGIGGGTGGSGSNITIKEGSKVTAIGVTGGAGIGGGYQGSGTKITISGSEVTATSEWGGAGIGGGGQGSGSENVLNGNAVVLATSGDVSKAALEGFDPDTGFVQSIAFTRQTESGRWSSNMYSNVTFSESFEIPADLTIPAGQTLSIEEGKTVTLSEKSGAKYIVEGTLKNDGTVTLPTDIEVKDNGTITTKTDFYRNGSTKVYKTGYQIYQTSAGVQKYTNLPNPDNTTLLKNSLNSDKFLYWYYLDKDGKEVAIKDGDSGDDVLPNQHKFYEKREEAYSISTSKQGEGTITPNVTEAYKGDEVTFTVTPAEGYELQENSLKVMAGTTAVAFTEKDGKYTFTMPDSAVTVSAVFEQSPEPIPTPPGPEPQPTPPGPQPGPEPEPTPTPEPTPDPSVNPEGGDGSGASSKTSDPFMGGIALALLGVATTGAVLIRKRK